MNEELDRLRDRLSQSAAAREREARDVAEAVRYAAREAAGGLLDGDRVFDSVSGAEAVLLRKTGVTAENTEFYFLRFDDGRLVTRRRRELVIIPQRPAPGGAGKP
jgi:ketosteroid isomerase-like protein